MLQPEDSDEDDYEGYFLQPVNAYNIAEKVKSANQELFSIPNPPSPSTVLTSVVNYSTTTTTTTSNNFPRVHFRSILEEFEPSELYSSEEEGYGEQFCSINDPENYVMDREESISETQSVDDFKANEGSDNDDHSKKGIMSEEEIEEICEELDDVIVVNDASNLQENSEGKQIDDDNEAENLDDDDNEVENLDDDDHSKSDKNDNNTETNDGNDIKINEKSTEDIKPTIIDYDPVPKIEDQGKPKKAKITIKSSSASTSRKPQTHHKVHPHSANQADHLKLKLNLRSCCEFKEFNQEKLPRYNGYHSQYGLSKEQIEKRQKRLEKYKKQQMERAIKIVEEETYRSQMNEEAFAIWLQNKMRHPKNKTKNMYDYNNKGRRHKRK